MRPELTDWRLEARFPGLVDVTKRKPLHPPLFAELDVVMATRPEEATRVLLALAPSLESRSMSISWYTCAHVTM
jgi:hypothetical protein